MAEKFGGVDMDNPTIAEYTKNAIRRSLWGGTKEAVMRKIGIPSETYDHYKAEVEREDKKKK